MFCVVIETCGRYLSVPSSQPMPAEAPVQQLIVREARAEFRIQLNKINFVKRYNRADRDTAL